MVFLINQGYIQIVKTYLHLSFLDVPQLFEFLCQKWQNLKLIQSDALEVVVENPFVVIKGDLVELLLGFYRLFH